MTGCATMQPSSARMCSGNPQVRRRTKQPLASHGFLNKEVTLCAAGNTADGSKVNEGAPDLACQGVWCTASPTFHAEGSLVLWLCGPGPATCLMHMSIVSAGEKPCRLHGQSVHVR